MRSGVRYSTVHTVPVCDDAGASWTNCWPALSCLDGKAMNGKGNETNECSQSMDGRILRRGLVLRLSTFEHGATAGHGGRGRSVVAADAGRAITCAARGILVILSSQSVLYKSVQ